MRARAHCAPINHYIHMNLPHSSFHTHQTSTYNSINSSFKYLLTNGNVKILFSRSNIAAIPIRIYECQRSLQTEMERESEWEREKSKKHLHCKHLNGIHAAEQLFICLAWNLWHPDALWMAFYFNEHTFHSMHFRLCIRRFYDVCGDIVAI